MKKIKLVSIFIIFSFLLFFFCLGSKSKSYSPSTYYRVYFEGVLLGVIESEDELKDYINEREKVINNEYNIDEIYYPQGLKINKIMSYYEDVVDTKTMYEKIQEKNFFTIDAYQVTIYSGYLENEYQQIYVLNEEIYTKALEIAISTFVGESAYNDYQDGMQKEIKDTGTYINQIYVDNEMKIKKVKASTSEKIYTDSVELAKYLLYGTTAPHKKYISNLGDTIEEIAFKHEISVEELLLSNPSFKNVNHLLYPGLEIVIEALDPQINVTVEQEVVEDLEDSYNTIERIDENMNVGLKKVLREGKDGLVRTKQMVKIVNGTTVYIEQVSKEQLSQPVDKIIVVGGKKVSGVGGSTWQWPTESGWRISSNYGYRINPFSGKREFHSALDIAGTGYGSKIFAANAGIIYRISEDDVNGKQVIINHQNGYYTMYNHLSKFGEITVGMAIERGYVIGYVGMSGSATGPHLHFGLWRDGPPFKGVVVNPWSLYS